eukprot:GHVO01027402.1.p1 GENE.GHVO01027402.1~~GHVO01027402.1.p1  ORF type:complete len:800 (-),score=116.16 GHVO01027402.1:412-2673(-)
MHPSMQHPSMQHPSMQQQPMQQYPPGPAMYPMQHDPQRSLGYPPMTGMPVGYPNQNISPAHSNTTSPMPQQPGVVPYSNWMPGANQYDPMMHTPPQSTNQTAPVLFRVKKHCFSMPGNVVKADYFQNSALGVVVNGGSLPDGSTPNKNAAGEIIIPNREPSNFSLLVDHLLSRKPLEMYTFSSICSAYTRLSEELDYWTLGRVPVEMPIRLYTRSRWSDLAGFYVLYNDKEADSLRLKPVAVQLDDSTVQSIRVLTRLLPSAPTPSHLPLTAFKPTEKSAAPTTVTQAPTPTSATPNSDTPFLSEAEDDEEDDKVPDAVVDTNANAGELDPKWTEACVALDEAMTILPIDSNPAQVVGLYVWNGYVLVLLDKERRPPCPKAMHALQNASLQHVQLYATGSGMKSTVTCPPALSKTTGNVSATHMARKYGNLAVAATAYGFTSAVLPPNEEATVTTILIKIPHSDRVVVFDVALADRFQPPTNEIGVSPIFPFAFRRMERHYLWMSPSFGLELQELRDGITGVNKIRCCHTMYSSSAQKICGTIASEYCNSFITPVPHTPTQGIFSGSKKEVKIDTWSCYHPMTGTRYSDGIKWVREFGDVAKVRFYPWGTLLMSANLAQTMAIVAVEQPELKQIYGERIQIVIKNFEKLQREEIDVAATPTLDRVFLMAAGQVASQAITPSTTKLEFEFSGPGRQKMKLVQVDIPDGAPIGKDTGSLQCLGILAEFDPEIGIYFQNEVSSVLCPKYTAASSEH